VSAFSALPHPRTHNIQTCIHACIVHALLHAAPLQVYRDPETTKEWDTLSDTFTERTRKAFSNYGAEEGRWGAGGVRGGGDSGGGEMEGVKGENVTGGAEVEATNKSDESDAVSIRGASILSITTPTTSKQPMNAPAVSMRASICSHFDEGLSLIGINGIFQDLFRIPMVAFEHDLHHVHGQWSYTKVCVLFVKV
jgi:hypothetical protein